MAKKENTQSCFQRGLISLLILALPGIIGGRAYAGYNVGSVGLMLRLMEEAAKA